MALEGTLVGKAGQSVSWLVLGEAAEEATRSGLDVELREPFQPSATDTDAIRVNGFDYHPGPRAHRLAAEPIAEFFTFKGRTGGR